MRKYSLFFAAIAASATLVLSCSKEIDAPGEETTPTTDVTEKDKEETPENKDENTGSPNYDGLFSLTLTTPETKTEFGDKVGESYPKIWKAGDKINVNGVDSDELKDEDIKDDGASATFYFASQPEGDTYKVVYPSTAYAGEGLLSIPAVQEVDGSGKYDPAADIMIGTGGPNETISMTNSVAWLKIKLIKGDYGNFGVSSIQVSGKDGQKLNGTFTIDGDNIVDGVDDVTEEEKTITLNVSGVSSLDETAKEFLIAVAPKDIEGGISVTVKDSKEYTMTKTSSNKLTKGQILALPPIKFQEYRAITNAADLVQFANEYNAGGLDNPYALLKNDIVFSGEPISTAAFNATGGIGNKKGDVTNYFNGVFDGGNKTIRGLVATVPLFAYIGNAGTVKNLTIDNSCSFTFTHPNTAEGMFGSVAGYHEGTLDKVSVAAAVTLADAEVTQVTALGGLAGIVVGTIDNECIYSGALTVPAGFSATDKKIYIGGLAGWISNAEGKVQNSKFEGTLENEGRMVASSETNEMKNNPQLIIGGIVGLNAGVVSSCEVASHATGVTVVLNDGSDHPYTGTIVTHSTNAYHYAVGGIVGRNNKTVSGCTNNAEIVNIFSAERGTGGNMNGRYLEVGGIVGYNDSGATISGSDNNGPIIDRANPKIHYVGGIVGRNIGSISSSDNSATGTIAVGTSHFTPYGARMLYAGGIIGSNENGASLSNIHNAAAINVSRIESATGFICRIGGVAGYSAADIDGATGGGTITNTGNIAQSTGIGHCDTPAGANDYGYHVGGIVGHTTKAVKNVSNNSGNITFTCNATGVGAQYVRLGGIIGKVDAASTVDIEKCMNTGNVTYTASASHKDNAATRYYYNYLGGIVGYANNAAIKGDSSTKCTNSGVIKGGDGGDNNNQATPSFMIGGIVGYITGDSSIEYCDLIGSGNAYNDHWSNRGLNASHDTPSVGGIAGQIVGADGTPIHVSHCNIASTASVNARRGAVGGIVGLAQYAAISDCNMPVIFQTSQSGYFYGGIVAAVINSTVSNCVFSGATIRSSQLQIAGGIVGQLDANSTIDGCSSSATDVSKNGTAVATTGGIAGKSVAGSTIQNCHYTATIGKICGDSNFTDGGDNIADL